MNGMTGKKLTKLYSRIVIQVHELGRREVTDAGKWISSLITLLLFLIFKIFCPQHPHTQIYFWSVIKRNNFLEKKKKKFLLQVEERESVRMSQQI